MAKSKRPLIWIVVLITVFVLVAGGLTAYFLLKKKPQEEARPYTEIEQEFVDKFAVDETWGEEDEDIISGDIPQEYLDDIGIFEIVRIYNKFGEYLVADVKENVDAPEKRTIIKYSGKSNDLQLGVIDMGFAADLIDFVIHDIADDIIVYSSTESSGDEHDLTLYSVAVIDKETAAASVKLTGLDFYYKGIENKHIIFARNSDNYWVFRFYYFDGTELINIPISDQYCYSFDFNGENLLLNCMGYNRIYNVEGAIITVQKTFNNGFVETTGSDYHTSYGGKRYFIDEVYNVERIVGNYFLVEYQKTYSNIVNGVLTRRYNNLDVYCKITYAVYNASKGELEKKLPTDNYELYRVNNSGIDGVGVLIQQKPFEGSYSLDHNSMIMYFDESFHKVMEYDASYGKITTYRNKQFVTAVKKMDSHISYVIDIDGNLLQSSSSTYILTGMNAMDGYIEAQDIDSQLYGMVDGNSNEIIPCEYKYVFPINSKIQTIASKTLAYLEDGVTVMRDVYYRFDHSDWVKIDNYTDEFNDWLALGLGVYFTKNDGVYSLYDYDGTLINSDITSVVFYENANKVFLTYCYNTAGGTKMVKFTSFNPFVKNRAIGRNSWRLDIYVTGENASYNVEKTRFDQSELIVDDSQRVLGLGENTLNSIDVNYTYTYEENGESYAILKYTLIDNDGTLSHERTITYRYVGYSITCAETWSNIYGSGGSGQSNEDSGDNTIITGFTLTLSNVQLINGFVSIYVDSAVEGEGEFKRNKNLDKGNLDLTLDASNLHADECFFGGYSNFVKDGDNAWKRNTKIINYFASGTTIEKGNSGYLGAVVVQSLWVKKAFNYDALSIEFENGQPNFDSGTAVAGGNNAVGYFSDYVAPQDYTGEGTADLAQSVADVFDNGNVQALGYIIIPYPDDYIDTTRESSDCERRGVRVDNTGIQIQPKVYTDAMAENYKFVAFYRSSAGSQVSISYTIKNGLARVANNATCDVSYGYVKLFKSNGNYVEENVNGGRSWNIKVDNDSDEYNRGLKINDQKFNAGWNLTISSSDPTQFLIDKIIINVSNSDVAWYSYYNVRYGADNVEYDAHVTEDYELSLASEDASSVTLSFSGVHASVSVNIYLKYATFRVNVHNILDEELLPSGVDNVRGGVAIFRTNTNELSREFEYLAGNIYTAMRLGTTLPYSSTRYELKGFYYITKSDYDAGIYSRVKFDDGYKIIEDIEVFPILQNKSVTVQFQDIKDGNLGSNFYTEKSQTFYAGETLYYNVSTLVFSAEEYIRRHYSVMSNYSVEEYFYLTNEISSASKIFDVGQCVYNKNTVITSFGLRYNSQNYDATVQYDLANYTLSDMYFRVRRASSDIRQINFYYYDNDSRIYKKYDPTGYSLNVTEDGFAPTPLESTFANYPPELFLAGWLVVPEGASKYEVVREDYYKNNYLEYVYNETRCNLATMNVYAVYLDNVFEYQNGTITRLNKPPITLPDGSMINIEYDSTTGQFNNDAFTLEYRFINKEAFEAALQVDGATKQSAYDQVGAYVVATGETCYKCAIIKYNGNILDLAIDDTRQYDPGTPV